MQKMISIEFCLICSDWRTVSQLDLNNWKINEQKREDIHQLAIYVVLAKTTSLTKAEPKYNEFSSNLRDKLITQVKNSD